MQTIWQDLRYGLRGLANRPSFTLLAVLNLGLGIGAATTIFSVIQNVLLDPFPYTDAHRVAAIQIHDTTTSRPGGRSFFQVPEFLDYQTQNHVFDDVIGGTNEDVLLTTTEGTEQFTGGATTPNTFQFLGVPAVLGRVFTPADATPDAPPVFVMAYKMWAAKYNRDPAILGRTFVLNGVPTTLVGIMPQRFTKLGADQRRIPGRQAQSHTGGRRSRVVVDAPGRRGPADAQLRGTADRRPRHESGQRPGGAAAAAPRSVHDRRREAAVLPRAAAAAARGTRH